MIFYIKENCMSLYMHFVWYVLLNHVISRKIICDSSYVFKEQSYLIKKINQNPTIYPIMLIININVICVDNPHFLPF